MKSDFTPRIFWRSRQLPDRFEDSDDFLVMFADTPLEFDKFLRQFAIRIEHPTKPHKRAHDCDVDFDGADAVQDAGQHRDPLLGEGVRPMPATALAFDIPDWKIKSWVSSAVS